MSTHETTPRDPDETSWFENLEQQSTAPEAGSATEVGSGTETGGTEVERAPAPTLPARLRVGTVVWGLILAMVGIGVAAIGAGAAVDLQAGIIVLLVVAGTALLGGALVAAHRSRR